MSPNAVADLSDGYDQVRSLIVNALNIICSDNFDDYFDLFADDAVWMMPNNYGDVHIEEAKSFYRFTKKFRFDQQISIDELVVSGDWAHARISFDGYLRAKNDDTAPPLRSVSRHIWILRRQADSSWKIARDIWNNPKDHH